MSQNTTMASKQMEKESLKQAKVSIATQPADLLKRITRFSAIVEREGKEELAYIANSGRLEELLIPGRTVFLTEKHSLIRKCCFDLIAVSLDFSCVWIDARIPNLLMAKALSLGVLPRFKAFRLINSEPHFGGSRLDFLISDGSKKCLLEVKSVTLVKEGKALFPDAPTQRGKHHLRSLTMARREGFEAAILFLIQREDGIAFSPNDEVDPSFCQAFREATQRGVKTYAYRCLTTPNEIRLDSEIPVSLW